MPELLVFSAGQSCRYRSRPRPGVLCHTHATEKLKQVFPLREMQRATKNADLQQQSGPGAAVAGADASNWDGPGHTEASLCQADKFPGAESNN